MTKQGYLWILDCIKSSDTLNVEVRNPNLRRIASNIRNKSHESVVSVIEERANTFF